MKGILGSLKFQLLEPSISKGVLGFVSPHFKFLRKFKHDATTDASSRKTRARDVTLSIQEELWIAE